MAADAGGISNLLYVSDDGDNFLYVFALPKGKLVGTITGFLGIAGLCSDSQGNVFVTDYQLAEIKEYRHGGTEPIAVLNDSRNSPIGCSVDPTTGNLAVANEMTETSSGAGGPGDVAIYPNAKGHPKFYGDPNIAYLADDSYDGAGNLYVSGLADSYAYSDFAVLHKRGSKLEHLALDQSFSGYSYLQSDGQYLAVASQNGDQIYQFRIKGTKGTEFGKTTLAGVSSIFDFWIQNHELYAPVISDDKRMVGFYSYPKGGQPTKTLLGFVYAFGATVSHRP